MNELKGLPEFKRTNSSEAAKLIKSGAWTQIDVVRVSNQPVVDEYVLRRQLEHSFIEQFLEAMYVISGHSKEKLKPTDGVKFMLRQVGFLRQEGELDHLEQGLAVRMARAFENRGNLMLFTSSILDVPDQRGRIEKMIALSAGITG